MKLLIKECASLDFFYEAKKTKKSEEPYRVYAMFDLEKYLHQLSNSMNIFFLLF